MSDWPPTTESPYSNPHMAAAKPGNFFTIANQDHPAYDLFRALVDQGWEWDIQGGRHWVHMRKGDRFVDFSLFGQGSFGCRNEHGFYPVCLEDFDNVWSNAMPHITKFMRLVSDERARALQGISA